MGTLGPREGGGGIHRHVVLLVYLEVGCQPTTKLTVHCWAQVVRFSAQVLRPTTPTGWPKGLWTPMKHSCTLTTVQGLGPGIQFFSPYVLLFGRALPAINETWE